MPLNTFVSTNLFTALTREERLRVSAFSIDKGTDLPRFFNADVQQLGEEPNETISREFEAFLILQAIQSPEKLSDAMLWFNEAAALQLQREDRDALLTEAYALEKEDALSKLQELFVRTERFLSFRETFQTVDLAPDVDPLDFPPARFSQIPEISLIMRDSQVAMGELASSLRLAEYRVVMTEVLDENRLARANSADTEEPPSRAVIAKNRLTEELLSWRNVISDMQARVTGDS